MKTTALAALLFCSVAASGACLSEPTPTVRYLIGEPASLLDVGMIRLRSYFDELSQPEASALRVNGSPPLVALTYDWRENRITVELVYVNVGPKEAAVEADCKRIVGLMHDGLVMADTTGRPEIVGMFNHAGYEKKGVPANLATELLSMTAVKATMLWRDDSAATGARTMTCEGKLTSASVSVTK